MSNETLDFSMEKKQIVKQEEKEKKFRRKE